MPDDAQPARALGDEHAAVGQEGNRPRMGELAGDHGDANLGLLGRVEYVRPRSEGRHRQARTTAFVLGVAADGQAQQETGRAADPHSDGHRYLPEIRRTRVYRQHPSGMGMPGDAAAGLVILRTRPVDRQRLADFERAEIRRLPGEPVGDVRQRDATIDGRGSRLAA